MNFRHALLAPCAILALALTGCGKGLSAVKGTVTLDGKPVDNATVTLHPVGDAGQPCAAVTRADGGFDIELPSGDRGALKGDYKITVTKFGPADSPPPESKEQHRVAMIKRGSAYAKPLLPEIYGNLQTTPFETKVPPTDGLKLDLRSDAKASTSSSQAKAGG